MRSLANKLWHDEAGVIISAELVLILTIVVIGVIVGLVQLQHAVVAELNDIGLAMSHLNQSYAFAGYQGGRKWWGPTSWTAGSSFIDLYDGAAITEVDVGAGYAYGGAYGYGYGYGAGGFGGGAFMGQAVFGTLVFADGTLVPLTWVASGTWSLPGGTILAATSANSNRLVLANGVTIGFLYGIPAIVELADGTLVAVRPGAAGTWVFADGRIITLDRERENTGILADGTTVVLRLANPGMVLLANGTVVAARAGAAGTLVLDGGRIINLQDAILPPGSEQSFSFGGAAAVATRGDAVNGTLIFADGTLVPMSWVASGTWSTPGGTVLAATSANSNRLALGAGKTVGFLFGLPAIVELGDDAIVAVRPGLRGTWVLADGRIITLVPGQENTGRFADGTTVVIRLADPSLVLLANGTTIEAEAGAAGTIVLKGGRILNIEEAILPPGSEQILIETPRASQWQHPIPLPAGPLYPGIDSLPPGVAPGVNLPPATGPAPDCCGDRQPGSAAKFYRKPRLTEEIPQGPAPQYLPQL